MATTDTATTPQKSTSMAFAFVDPESVLNSNPLDYLGSFLDISGDYYRPPVSLDGLANLMTANGHHNSILHFKKNMVLNFFQPSRLLDYDTMQSIALDYHVLGNAYGQLFKNRFGKVMRIGHLHAIKMRRGKQPGQFFMLQNDGSVQEFAPGEVIHIKEGDIKQGIYGVPEYLGGVQSVLLSEDAGLFRRKYYLNGAHMGYILLTNDADLDDETAQEIEKKVTDSKGPGNFRSLYINIGRSNAKEPVQVIPVGDIATKDEFERVKNVTRDEILSMHRMQPGLSGIMPDNTGGYGDVEKIMRVYYQLEIVPMQKALEPINKIAPGAVKFAKPDWLNEAAAG